MKYEKIKGAQNHHLFRPFDGNGVLRDVIWVRFHRSGKGRLEESLKTSHLGEARDKRDTRISEFLGERPRGKREVFLVEDKFTEFIELKKGKSPRTCESIKNQWDNHLKEYFGGMLLEDVTETEWMTYVNKKRETLPDRKFFNDRKWLSMFLNWLHRAGLIEKLPKLDDVDPELNAGKVFSKDEIKALLTHSTHDLRIQIYMAVTMGMRKGEIFSLEWSQVDFAKKTIFLPAAKTKIRKARTFALSPLCFDLLSARKEGSTSPWVFPSLSSDDKPLGRHGNSTAWNTARQKAKVSGRFHDLRHTFLTHAFKESVNPALICHYAGLSLDEAQRTYLHFTVDDTRLIGTLYEVPT